MTNGVFWLFFDSVFEGENFILDIENEGYWLYVNTSGIMNKINSVPRVCLRQIFFMSQYPPDLEVCLRLQYLFLWIRQSVSVKYQIQEAWWWFQISAHTSQLYQTSVLLLFVHFRLALELGFMIIYLQVNASILLCIFPVFTTDFPWSFNFLNVERLRKWYYFALFFLGNLNRVSLNISSEISC